MTPRSHIIARVKTLSVPLAVCFALSACHPSSTSSAPTIVVSRVPAADQESPGKTDIIEGRATAARPGQRIVLYTKTDGRWGVHPRFGQRFTNIESDGRWKSSIQLGLQYAALLVDPDYNPPEQTESQPVVGDGVVALAVIDGRGAAPVFPSPKPLRFSGYEWTTSTGPIFRRSCERLDGQQRRTPSSHLGKPGKMDRRGVEAYAQPGIRNIPLPGARGFSSRAYCCSYSYNLGWRWHREE